MMNPDAARLGMAECGAFSGGGGFLLRPRFDVYHDAANEYRRFFEEHPELYAGLQPHAQVAVLALPEQGWYGNSRHSASVRAVTEALTEAHVLFDYVSESRLTEATLAQYEAVVAPDVEVLTDEQLELLSVYPDRGGQLLIMGDLGVRDEAGTERGGEDLAILLGQYGQRRVAWFDTAAELAASLDRPPVLTCADKGLEPHVKVNAFRSRERLVVHVVNYNVPLGVEPEPVEVAEGVELGVPLPEGAEVGKGRVCAPGEEDREVEVRMEGGRAKVSVGDVRIYAVVEVGLGG